MNDRRKSDGSIVPEKHPNKGTGAPVSAEGVEERGPAKGNASQQTRLRTQDRESLQNALDRIRQVAKREKEVRFTTLGHHVYDVGRLREAYFGLKREAAPGVDGETWEHYGEKLEANLQDLSGRLKRGAYRAKPVKRVYIPKADGRRRPIGVTTLEDKIVQRATTEVLNAIYETDFKGFSYGSRPKRGAHNALDAVTVGIETRKVNWVLDADIRGFFDAIDHDWLMKFTRHRIADRRVLRHVKKWLNAGVLEEGVQVEVERGTPQGGSISPLLANIYLHYVLDLWADHWRRHEANGEVILVRYVDDFIAGFRSEEDARRFREELSERLEKFGLELHAEKTRVIEIGRFAASNRSERGQRKPETFDFLGFTHCCEKTRKGRFCVLRRPMRKRTQAKLKAIKAELRRRMHNSVSPTGSWLRKVVQGYYRYYAVPRNSRALQMFRYAIIRLWYQVLRRRSQKKRLTWTRMFRLANSWLPYPRILHPYPSQRLRV